MFEGQLILNGFVCTKSLYARQDFAQKTWALPLATPIGLSKEPINQENKRIEQKSNNIIDIAKGQKYQITRLHKYKTKIKLQYS